MKPDEALTTPTILVTQQDSARRFKTVRVLDEAGYKTMESESAQEALDCLLRAHADILIADFNTGAIQKAELLRQAKALQRDLQLILIAAEPAATDVPANEIGCSEYRLLRDPVSKERLLRTVQQILDAEFVRREGGAVRINGKKSGENEKLIYRSGEMRKIARMVEQLAASTATVLLTGESGTGKEVLADSIHSASPRAAGPFIKVNCAALPESLVEAELFGYEKGAFTGAHARKQGRFEMADGGTLFLDEIAEVSPAIQVKLLRVLQNRSFELIGGTRTIRADVRLIAATNKDLYSEVKANRIREDLFYRLNVISITVPPLRERRDDIELLAKHFLRIYAERNKKEVTGITEDAMRALFSYEWPGNVRELENAVERAVIFATGRLITIGCLPPQVSASAASQPPLTFTIGGSLRDIESRAIELTLHYTRGDKHKAARILGIAPRTIYRHLKRQEQEQNVTRSKNDKSRGVAEKVMHGAGEGGGGEGFLQERRSWLEDRVVTDHVI